MTNVNRLIFLTISLSSMAVAQLPFFLQRFRPVKHGLLSSGSTSYPSFASSLFPLSSSLSSAYAPHNSFFGSSGFGSSPLSSASGLGSLSFASSPFTASASSLSPFHFGGSSFSSTNFGPSSFLAASSYGSPNFATSHHLSSPHRFSSSNLAHSLVDFGNGGYNEGLGGFDQSELLDDYPGFSHAGFGKDLNFAGSQTVKLQSSPQPHYNGGDIAAYYQRSADEKK